MENFPTKVGQYTSSVVPSGSQELVAVFGGFDGQKASRRLFIALAGWKTADSEQDEPSTAENDNNENNNNNNNNMQT
jgi:hypothetical protein